MLRKLRSSGLNQKTSSDFLEEQTGGEKKRKRPSVSENNSADDASSPNKKYDRGGKKGHNAKIFDSAEPYYLEVPLDMVRTQFRYVMPDSGPMSNNTGAVNYHATKSITVCGEMTPDPKKDAIFPILDPSPLLAGKVHRFYAKKSGEGVDSRVAVVNVKLATGVATTLEELAEKEAKKLESSRLNLSKSEVHEKISLLQQSVRLELERLIDGRELTAPVYYTKKLSESETEAHEKMLVGQSGLFVRDGIQKENLPTFSNGKIIGLFSGAYLKSPTEHTTHFKAYGGLDAVDRYSLNIKKSGKDASNKWLREAGSVTVSPIGVANSMAFANTATTPDFKNYDEKRINSIFVPFHVTMKDKFGKEREELVAAVVALDNLRGQVLLDYGENFLEQLQRDGSRSAAVKQEPSARPVNVESVPRGRPGLRTRDRETLTR